MTGVCLAPGQTGEICLAGPRITRGYWRDAERTREAFHGDGWFRTGDVGHLDRDGFLYLTDRRKDMIISGGENIASSEVERVLHEHPAIAEAAVIGRPDERWGERPVAVVVPRTGAGIVEDDVIRHCRGALAGFKVPSEVHVVAELPRNPSGKVLKRVLRDAFAVRGYRGVTVGFIVYVLAVYLAAGMVKGVVGLGLPTISLALIAAVFGLKEAMVLLLAPSLVTNAWQAVSGGRRDGDPAPHLVAARHAVPGCVACLRRDAEERRDRACDRARLHSRHLLGRQPVHPADRQEPAAAKPG